MVNKIIVTVFYDMGRSKQNGPTLASCGHFCHTVYSNGIYSIYSNFIIKLWEQIGVGAFLLKGLYSWHWGSNPKPLSQLMLHRPDHQLYLHRVLPCTVPTTRPVNLGLSRLVFFSPFKSHV